MSLPTFDLSWSRLTELLSYDASSPLIFSSGLFLFLFAAFMMLYGRLRNAPTARILYVVAFSLYFYYKSSGIYFLLLLFASVSDFVLAQLIWRSRKGWAKRLWVALSVLVNLGMLGYFKYTDFLIEIANSLFGEGFLQFRNIFLPVGISFFVFQSMSYTIDIYRGQLRPLDRWIDYCFYLSFFPQLVAGPIVRARDFIPQIRQNPLRITREMFGTGVCLILTGLFKKAVISDYISLNFVDRIFDEPLLYSGFECLMGIYGYALQIYCDFSGYSDMAIGIALLMGFRFPKNFDAPYRSATITEFWRRWHISLSSWLRDYLYISLGGNRKGRMRTYGNLLLTMLLGGRTARRWPCISSGSPPCPARRCWGARCRGGAACPACCSRSISSASAGCSSAPSRCRPWVSCSIRSSGRSIPLSCRRSWRDTCPSSPCSDWDTCCMPCPTPPTGCSAGPWSPLPCWCRS